MNLRCFTPERYLQCTAAERAMTLDTTALNWRRFILRANAAYLGVASIAGLLTWDIPAIFFGTGTEARVIGSAQYAGIGFSRPTDSRLPFYRRRLLRRRHVARRTWQAARRT